MASVRTHLRTSAVAWLVCHVLMFSALVPRDCCAAHGHGTAASAAAPSCHEAVPAPAPAACRLTGMCDAPAAALAAVLLQGATPASPPGLGPRPWRAAGGSPPARERLCTLSVPPDAPPPRA